LKVCIIIPVYNHEAALPGVVAQLKVFQLPCLLVNDGSSLQCSQVLAELESRESNWITLITLAQNYGKGAAVIEGFKSAIGMGFTHALQIDADGQHDPSAIPEFIAAANMHSGALILGKPVFDESIPKSRLYGRQITNFWIRINTVSDVIADGMCGFRLYPLAAVKQLISTTELCQRMDFDIDIVVRLYWLGLQVINIPVKVCYPKDGVSHFRLWRDNLMISKTHARLFFGMLLRLPKLLLRPKP
jgi:glycosyltransferase involved in cell wall biosynthesis